MNTNVNTLHAAREIGRELYLRILLESDNKYFELGARTIELSGGQMSWMSNCVSIPVGCVIHRTRRTSDESEANEWVTEFEQTVRAIGSNIVRIYVQEPSTVLESALENNGFQRRVECALLAFPERVTPVPDAALRRVATDADMEKKCAYDAESAFGPDGHQLDPQHWHIAMVTKWRTKLLDFYFIERSGEVCGTVGAMYRDGVLRLKNLTVRPAFRRQGVGRQAVLALWRKAIESSCILGTFGLEGQAGYKMYRSVGMQVGGAQHEWTKNIS